MKKLLILLVLVGMTMDFAIAQTAKRTTAWSLMDSYKNRENDPQLLVDALEAINEACGHEKTGIQGLTFYYKGEILYLMNADASLSASPNNYRFESYEAFKQALTLGDKTIKGKDEMAHTYLLSLVSDEFNMAVQAYGEGDYASAFYGFKNSAAMNDYIGSLGVQQLVSSDDAIANAALSARYADMNDEAMALYEEMIAAGTANALVYINLAGLHKQSGNVDKAKEVVAAGIAMYPDDVNLVLEDVQFYLDAEDHEAAVGKLANAISLDPENAKLHYALGQTHYMLGNLDDAEASFASSVEKDDTDYKAHYMIGVVWTTRGNAITEEMNNVPPDDDATYDRLEIERNELYKKAMPYFDKALEMEPDDKDVQKAIAQISGIIGE